MNSIYVHNHTKSYDFLSVMNPNVLLFMCIALFETNSMSWKCLVLFGALSVSKLILTFIPMMVIYNQYYVKHYRQKQSINICVTNLCVSSLGFPYMSPLIN